jgi:hypothetical protein
MPLSATFDHLSIYNFAVMLKSYFETRLFRSLNMWPSLQRCRSADLALKAAGQLQVQV